MWAQPVKASPADEAELRVHYPDYDTPKACKSAETRGLGNNW